jgi:hypothetical protein
MEYRETFVVEPGARVRLGKIEPAFKDKHESHDAAKPEIQRHVNRIAKLQYLLYADGNQSLLVVQLVGGWCSCAGEKSFPSSMKELVRVNEHTNRST